MAAAASAAAWSRAATCGVFHLGRIAAATLLQGVQGRKQYGTSLTASGPAPGAVLRRVLLDADALLMFASGASNMGWMVALGIVMLAEKRLGWGRRLVVPIGAALLVWGSVLLLGTRLTPAISTLTH
jgi:Predicted metal-binding integral membrane protein (DUF2182)